MGPAEIALIFVTMLGLAINAIAIVIIVAFAVETMVYAARKHRTPPPKRRVRDAAREAGWL